MSEPSNPDYTNERIKHLELIQAVVARMYGASAAMKRYCIIAAAAGFAIHKTLGNSHSVLALIVLVIVFWLLDARYLQQEKWFRDIYDAVRVEPRDQQPDFRLTPDAPVRRAKGITFCIINWSTAGLYLPLVVLLILYWWAQAPDLNTCITGGI